jgi:hypothetical protein
MCRSTKRVRILSRDMHARAHVDSVYFHVPRQVGMSTGLKKYSLLIRNKDRPVPPSSSALRDQMDYPKSRQWGWGREGRW